MKLPRAAILTVGDELLDGRIVNTNAAYLAYRLTDRGFLVSATETTGDDEFAIADAIKGLCARADTVLIAGGLGPTPDDVTREALAGAAGVLLVPNRALRQQVAKKTGGRAPRKNARMARVPEGAHLFANPVGVAAGLCVAVGGTPVYALPGVPMEMEAIFEGSVVADLERRFLSAEPPPLRVLRIHGPREAEVADLLGDLLARGGEPTVGVTVKTGVITITVSGEGTAERAEAIRKKLGDDVFGENDDTLASVVLRALRERELTLGTAESITGGLVASLCVDIPGASTVLRGAVIPYTSDLKHELLGIPRTVLKRAGNASADLALRMARTARKRLGVDVAVATTGEAGPMPEGEELRAGGGFVAIAGPKAGKRGEAVHACQFRGDRNTIRRRFAWAALDLLRRHLG